MIEKLRRIVYVPPEDSHYTGMLSGIYYVDGKQVTGAKFRKSVFETALNWIKSNEEKRSNRKVK